LFFAGALVLTAAGACAQTKPYGTPAAKADGGFVPVETIQCEQNECVHEVKVDESQTPCKVVIHPAIMVVYKTRNAKVVWELKTPGYEFVSVKFKDQDEAFLTKNKEYLARVKVPSKDQFYDMHIGATTAFYRDKNTVDGAWYYSVAVKKGDKKCSIDPPIINGF
jgi:hypothetical protein